jgi:hypothetical protein
MSDGDAGQIIDGLISRKEAYERTRDYYLGETVDGLIEDDCDEEIARDMIDVYDRLINIVFTQLQEQRKQDEEKKNSSFSLPPE